MDIVSNFFVLWHPLFGYLGGSKQHTSFIKDIERARKFAQRNFAASCMKQKLADERWEIKEIRYFGFEISTK